MNDILQEILDAKFPICVYASAGTGKTYSLVEKVKNIVSSGVNPQNILCFTFSKDSAQEFRNRIPNNEMMTIGTIHSVALKIITENSKKRYYVIDGGMLYRFVTDIFKLNSIDFDKYNRYLSKIDLAKNIFLDYYEMLENRNSLLTSFFENDLTLIKFAIEFEAKKERQHKITFSDMQLKAYVLLKNNPDILEKRQELWRYIFLDEAQDASNVDIALVNILAKKYNNLFAVADIKQKIYGFRCGDDSFGLNGSMLMKNFTNTYPTASIFSLPTTFRNSVKICNAGNMIAKKIDGSVIDTINKYDGIIHIHEPFISQRDEARHVSRIAIEKFGDGKSVRILYRTNAQSLTFQQIMLQNNIPYSINQDVSIFSTKEAKSAISCCEFAMEYDNMTITEKVSCIKSLKPLVSNKFELYAVAKKMQEAKLDCFKNQHQFISDKNIVNVFHELLFLKKSLSELQSISEIFSYVASICSGNKSFSDNAEDNLIGISEFASECKTMEEFREMVKSISRPRLLEKGERAISIGTIHSSKGLDSDCVFVTGVVDGCMPHSSAKENIEEELNIFYVAVTRAKFELHVSSFLSFGKKKYYGNRFIDIIS